MPRSQDADVGCRRCHDRAPLTICIETRRRSYAFTATRYLHISVSKNIRFLSFCFIATLSFDGYVVGKGEELKEFRMSVSAVSSAPVAQINSPPVAQASPAPTSASDPSNDGDSDDSSTPAPQASPAPGTGTTVDKTA